MKIGSTTQLDSLIYTSKIKIKDKKLAEFNYKVLNNILSCKYNLYKWKIMQDPYCDICGETQDILHLLFLCKNAKTVWKYVGTKLDITIDPIHIIFGIESKTMETYIIGLVSYLLYKEWVVSSNNQKSRNTMSLHSFILPELQRRRTLYEYVMEFKICNVIDMILNP